ncbi:MAG TPA: M23 family metallopeptidase [Herpetosiphonaceae bacterium]
MTRRWMLVALALVASIAGNVTPGAATSQAVSFADPVLGVAFDHARGEQVLLDGYLSDSYGATVVESEAEGERHGGDSERHMAMRVSWLRAAPAADAHKQAAAFRAAYPGLGISQRAAQIGGMDAAILEQAPGRVPSTYAYVAAHGRLYEIILPVPALDAAAWERLGSLRFVPATQDLASRNLTRAEDALGGGADGADPAKQPQAGAPAKADPANLAPAAMAGCVSYPTTKYLQTPFTSAANGNGWSNAGPSYYGQGYHQGCSNAGSTNDYYALDMRMRSGDPVLSGCGAGVVRYAGWAGGGWSTFGRIVVIDCGSGYWSMSAHLSAINVAAGNTVNSNTVIGRAGGSGNWTDNYFAPHIHEGFYLNPSFDYARGGMYGGQSAQRVKVMYFRNGSNYYWYLTSGQALSW